MRTKLLKSLLTIACLLCSIGVYAQQLISQNVQRQASVAKKNTVAEYFMEYGYCGEYAMSLGLGEQGTFRALMRVPAAFATKFAGAKISTIKVGIGSFSTNPNAQIIILSDLDGSEPIYSQEFTPVKQAWNEVVLDIPYTLESKEFYVGYQIYASSSQDFPFGIDDLTANEYGDIVGYLDEESCIYQYLNLGSQSFGNNCIKLDLSYKDSQIFFEDFEQINTTTMMPEGWTTFDAATSIKCAQPAAESGGQLQAFGGDYALVSMYDDENPRDAWAISKAITLEANVTYHFGVYAFCMGYNIPDEWEMTIGTAQTAEAQTTTIIDSKGSNAVKDSDWTLYSGTFTPTTTGTYYVAIHHCTSQPGANISMWDEIFINGYKFQQSYLAADTVGIIEINGTFGEYEISLPISLINTKEIAGLQCDIYLPDGLTPVMQGDKYDIVLSSRAEGFNVTAKLRNDGALRVVIANTTLNPISGNAGELFTIKLQSNKQYRVGDNIIISNVVMTGSNYTEYECSQLVIPCTKKDGILGDVNDDKKINITDIVLTVGQILNAYDSLFVTVAADIDQDGEITIVDAVGIINLVLDEGDTPSQPQNYTVEPANGSIVEELTDIFITWEDAAKIDVNVDLMVGGIKAYMIEGENKTFVTDVFTGPAWGDYIILTLMNPTTHSGEYLIEIPDNMITVDGEVVPAFNLNYTIPGMSTSAATFESASDNGSLNTVFVTATPCNELTLNEGVLTMQDVKMSQGETKDLVIGLTNEAPYTAFQMDVTLPAGLNIEHIALSGRANGHTLQWQAQADGSVRIVGYALDNAAITGNDGALLTLTVSSDSQFETGEVVISNTIFSTRQLVSHRLERMTAKVSNITALNDVVTTTRIYATGHKVVVDSPVAQEAAISTIDGVVQRVALQPGRNEIPLQQGVYIVAVDAEVKKVVIR